jgi:hypothetical protein
MDCTLHTDVGRASACELHWEMREDFSDIVAFSKKLN